MALLAASACTDDALVSPSRPGVVDENGMVTLAFSTNIPELKLTKSVDINGERINTLWLVAFNEEGYMVSRVLAELTSNDVQGTQGGEGTFTAQVPSSTRRLHFLANVNMDNFSDQDNIGRHENEVIAPLVSSSGNLVYWGRETFTDVPNLENRTIILYRNQALVDYDIQKTGLEVTGWAICNQYAYGTVAPFNSSATNLENGNGFLFDLYLYDFVTTLPEAYNVKQSDDQDVGEASQSQEEGTNDPRYLFETPNPEDDQVYVIMKIKKENDPELYYKIMLVDEDKEPYPIIRNHKYLIEIKDVNTAYGVGSFEEAKNATPANNPWITISDQVPEVSSGNTTLRIEGETTVLYQEDKPGEITIDFYYNGTEQPTVSWIDNEGVTASNEIAPEDIVWDSQTGKGTITLHVNRPAQQGLTRGTLQVKAGALSRRVQVITSQLFEFSPVWVSSEIPLLDGEAITVLFHIPDDFPQELLPVEVKFGCDLIDARADQPLAVVMEENLYNVDWWNSSTQSWQNVTVEKDWNYKYVYTADHTGEHRVNFRTILTDLPVSVDEETEFHIYMEGDDPQTGNDLFRQRDLYFAFQPENNTRRILLDGGDRANNYATQTISQLDPVTGETIEIPFTLGTLGNNNSFNPATLNGNTTLWVYYDKEVLKPTWTDATATDPYGNHYAAYTATQAKNTLTFESISPVFDSYVALTARSADGYPASMGFTGAYDLEGNIRTNAFRSASVTLRTTGRMDFTVALSATGSNYEGLADGETYSLPYGEGQDLYLRIGIPQKAQGKTFGFNVETEHFEPAGEGWTHDGTMWTYPLQNAAATQTFRFRANRLASGETLRFSTDNSVGFNDVEVTLANTPLSGTIQLPADETFQVENPYVILERVSDGTRIGTFNLLDNPNGQSEVNYELTLRSEYNLNATDRVTVRWMRVTDENEFTSNGLLLQDIMGNGVTIPLVKKE